MQTVDADTSQVPTSEETPLLAQDNVIVDISSTESNSDEPKRHYWWLGLGILLISGSLLGLLKLPSAVQRINNGVHLNYRIVGIGHVEDDSVAATVEVTNVPRFYWPLTVALDRVQVVYKDVSFAECSVPPITVDLYTPTKRTLDVTLQLRDPKTLAAIIRDRLSALTAEPVKVLGKAKIHLHYVPVPLPAISIKETLEVPQMPISLDSIKDIFTLDIPRADDESGITVVVGLKRPSLSGTLHLMQSTFLVQDMDGRKVATVRTAPQELDLVRHAGVTATVKPIDRQAIFDLVGATLKGRPVIVNVRLDVRNSDPCLAFLAELNVDIPLKLSAINVVEEIQLIRKKSEWLPRGAAVFTNPFSAELTVLGLSDCRVYRSANQQLFATIDEPTVEPPIKVPGRARHYKVDQSMNGKFEGSLVDLMRTVRELFAANGTAYFDVDSTVTLLLDRFHVQLCNTQERIPVRMYTED
jgi:hypothetical protein